MFFPLLFLKNEQLDFTFFFFLFNFMNVQLPVVRDQRARWTITEATNHCGHLVALITTCTASRPSLEDFTGTGPEVAIMLYSRAREALRDTPGGSARRRPLLLHLPLGIRRRRI